MRAAGYGIPTPALMSDTETKTELITDQAEREATGARQYGRYLEEFEVGAVYKHWPAKTVTEADDHLFCLITMNHHPLHINDVYASQSQQGQNVVVGPLVYSLAVGMTVGDVSGKAIANLATEELSTRTRSSTATRSSASPRCSRCGRRSRSPTAASSRSTPASTSRTATLVAEFKRAVLVPRKNPGPTARRRPRPTSTDAGHEWAALAAEREIDAVLVEGDGVRPGGRPPRGRPLPAQVGPRRGRGGRGAGRGRSSEELVAPVLDAAAGGRGRVGAGPRLRLRGRGLGARGRVPRRRPAAAAPALHPRRPRLRARRDRAPGTRRGAGADRARTPSQS